MADRLQAPASSLDTEMNSQRTDESVLYSSGIKNCFIITSDCARDSLDQVTKQQRKRMYNKTWGISPLTYQYNEKHQMHDNPHLQYIDLGRDQFTVRQAPV
eukprot:158639_1